MNEAYLSGRALASALGPDLDSALRTLAAGGVQPVPVALGDGSSWPCYAIADTDPDWTARSRRLVQHAAAESGALAGAREGALFIASSSLDIGELETSLDFERDHQQFAETVAGWLGWRGPIYTVSTACTSGLNALLSARTLVRHGVMAEALVLGLELRNKVTVGGFGGMQLLSATGTLPYGAERNGLVLGEAVAALHVSSTPARWRIAGGANVVDGRDPAGTIESAVIQMCAQALADSGLEAGDIGLLKPQAAGGVASDATEARALHQVFDPLPPLVSFKASIGHTLGASGVAELALLTACLEKGAWPLAHHAGDPELKAPLAAQAPSHARHVMASILGFGGGHAAVVLEDTQAASGTSAGPLPSPVLRYRRAARHPLGGSSDVFIGRGVEVKLVAHVLLDPLPADWREQLVQRLGTRPRRIGSWAELALYGARRCLDAAGEDTLPASALLRVVGTGGPMVATRAVAEQSANGLPMPFSFMQSQPSQMLAAVSQHLGWQGDARYVLSRDLHATLQLAQLESTAAGVLIGTVDEDRRTEWWRYAPAPTAR